MNTQTAVNKNESLLTLRVENFNKIKGARVGDYLKLPYGLYTRFTHEWDDVLQTGGNSNSYYLGNGYISYSGGLDSGVNKEDILPTNETKKGAIWFFDGDYAGANRGVYFDIDFRVFELKEGANTNGLPQIAAYEKAEFLKTCDTITRINGNGQPYTLPLPLLCIKSQNINDAIIEKLYKDSGLMLKKTHWCYEVQPIKHGQMTSFLTSYNFKTSFCNNSMHKNTLFLEFNH